MGFINWMNKVDYEVSDACRDLIEFNLFKYLIIIMDVMNSFMHEISSFTIRGLLAVWTDSTLGTMKQITCNK